MQGVRLKLLPKVKLYTDGSAIRNPGPGGYGAILLFQDEQGRKFKKEISQGYKRTTNNRMELLGVIAGLKCLRMQCSVDIYSDSQYVVNAFRKHWIDSWIRNNSLDERPNFDLWRWLVKLTDFHLCTFHWVKGHNGNKWNERCDEIAQLAARSNYKIDDIGYH